MSLKEITAGMSEPIRTIRRTKADIEVTAKGGKTATAFMQSEIEKIMNLESEIQKALNPYPHSELEKIIKRESEIQKIMNPFPEIQEAAVNLYRRQDEWKMMSWQAEFEGGDDLALIQAFLFSSPELPVWVDSGMKDRFGRYMEKNKAGDNRKLDEFFKIPQARFKSIKYEDELDDYCYLKYHWKLFDKVIFRVLDLKYPPQTGVVKEARGKAKRWSESGGKAYFDECKAAWDKMEEPHLTANDAADFLATFPEAAQVVIKNESKGKYPVIAK